VAVEARGVYGGLAAEASSVLTFSNVNWAGEIAMVAINLDVSLGEIGFRSNSARSMVSTVRLLNDKTEQIRVYCLPMQTDSLYSTFGDCTNLRCSRE
jgi:hypothetical protein